MSFNLNEEVICNHLVTTQVKKLWKVQMEIAHRIIEVCNKHGLKLWAEGGTLLGTVRHQGFIPWDDDIDFVMMREDYEKLKLIGPKEFREPYFFQSFNTDNWAGGLVRICRSDTAMIDERYKELKPRNYGIFVDIIVMDGVPDDEHKFVNECKSVQQKMRILGRYYEFSPNYSSIRACLRTIATNTFFLFVSPQKYHDKIVKLLSHYSVNDNHSCAKIQLESRFKLGPQKINRRECKWYSDTVWLPFHDMQLPAPKQWKEVLTSQFGEQFMTPRKDPNWHKITIVNTEKPYTEVLHELQNNKV